MSDLLIQRKIFELQNYISLPATDPNYVDPSQVYIPVQHPSWAKPKKLPITGAQTSEEDPEITTVTRSYGRLTGLSSRNVSVTFTNPLMSSNIIERVDVYRYSEFDGKLTRQDVLHYFNSATWFNQLGFSLVIDDDEDLSGIIISYEFISIING